MLNIILPTAGRGTRLRPHTHSKPKSLVLVAGKSVLSHVMQNLSLFKEARYTFIVDDQGPVIKDYIDTHFGIEANYVEQKEKLGPGHAVWCAKPFVEEGDDVLVVYNDTLYISDLSDLRSLESDGAIFVKKTDDPQRFGITHLDGGYIKEIIEKPKEFVGDLAVVGMYYFKDGKAFMDACDKMISEGRQEKGEFYINEAIHTLIGEGHKLEAREIDVWLDCGQIPSLLETNKYLLSKAPRSEYDFKDTRIVHPVHIGDDCVISGSTIGPNASIASGSRITNSSVNDSIIGFDAIIEGCHLQDSVVGDNCCVEKVDGKMNIGDHSRVSG